ncbi:MAG: chromate transporter [Alphaproteobacteria bacterium]|nr:chromate transporter [Alphaproteobacteria bacterium]
MIYITLFYQFFLIGLFAIGGGAATIPFLFDLSKKYGWFSVFQLSDMIAISESTPGPVGVNMATFAGFQAGGFLGGVVATLGLICPSVIVIVAVSKLMMKFQSKEGIDSFFNALQVAAAALILFAAYHIAALCGGNILNFVVFGLVLTLMFVCPKSAIFYLVLSGILGMVLKL